MNIYISEPDLVLIVEALNVYKYSAEDNDENSYGYPYYSIEQAQKLIDHINNKMEKRNDIK